MLLYNTNCPLVVNERVGWDPGQDGESWNANSEASEVVGHVVAIGFPGEGDAVLEGRNVGWGRGMVGKPAVFVEVDDKKAMRCGEFSYRRPLDEENETYRLSQYEELRRESYKCLAIISPAAILLVGCIESIVQHSGLI